MTIPTNIADAIAGMQDGTVGASQQVTIDDVFVSALTGLRVFRRKEVTRRPVQAGYSVSKGVIDTPTEIEMDIVLSNPDYSPEGFVKAGLSGDLEQLTETWTEKVSRLFKIWESKEIVPATTHDEGFPPEYIIESLDQHNDPEEDWEGWEGTVRLVHFGSQSGATAVDLAEAKMAATAYVGSF